MPSFYNPYMKTPDFAQGGSDIMQQLMLMKMLRQLMGGNQQPQVSPDTSPQGAPPPMSNIQPPQGIGNQILGGAQTQLGQQQMDPQIMMLLQMLMRRQQAPPSPQF